MFSCSGFVLQSSAQKEENIVGVRTVLHVQCFKKHAAAKLRQVLHVIACYAHSAKKTEKAEKFVIQIRDYYLTGEGHLFFGSTPAQGY